MASQSLCGSTIRHRRGMLALIWTLISFVTTISMGTAAVYSLVRRSNDIYYSDDDQYQGQEEGQDEHDKYNSDSSQRVAMTSEGLTFTAVWTALISLFVAIFGTIVLGFQGPRQYYSCCSSNVMRTSQLTLGVFMGILVMFANLTLICSFIFREYMMSTQFEYDGEGENDKQENCGDGEDCHNQYVNGFVNVERSANLFSMVCLFITALHGFFACIIFMFQGKLESFFYGE
mmetsp:Transcript_33708/g.77792  ORF Transcript_33708/g.77792 Transcript_33708/m.77792 type:complete len:231 (-) Transcript_33708:580-1272(-)